VFSFGRANIKGKLGKRLTQNLESHHSSDFLFTMRGDGKGDWGGLGKLWQHGRRQGQTGTDWDRLARPGMTGTEREQEQQQERVLARELELELELELAVWEARTRRQMTKEHLARGRTSMLPLSPTKWPSKDGAKGKSITKGCDTQGRQPRGCACARGANQLSGCPSENFNIQPPRSRLGARAPTPTPFCILRQQNRTQHNGTQFQPRQ
jgi:hypothetical protein